MKTSLLRACFVIVLLATLFSLAASAQSGGLYLKGVVKSSSDRPQTYVWVSVSQGGVEKGRSLTGDDGKYYISDLAAGEYEISVMRGDRQVYYEKITLAESSRYDISLK